MSATVASFVRTHYCFPDTWQSFSGPAIINPITCARKAGSWFSDPIISIGQARKYPNHAFVIRNRATFRIIPKKATIFSVYFHDFSEKSEIVLFTLKLQSPYKPIVSETEILLPLWGKLRGNGQSGFWY